MRIEVGRAIAEHNAGLVDWIQSWIGGDPSNMEGIFAEVDKYLIDRPGYKVTVIVEYDSGQRQLPEYPHLLRDRA